MPDPITEITKLLQLNVTMPYESAFVAVITAWSHARTEMDPAVRDEWDRLGLDLARPGILFLTDAFNKLNVSLGITEPPA